jgi:hypothetical protein
LHLRHFAMRRRGAEKKSENDQTIGEEQKILAGQDTSPGTLAVEFYWSFT